MPELVLITDHRADGRLLQTLGTPVQAEDYLATCDTYPADTVVINLCRSLRYLSRGYFCSLLAEARGHRVWPSVTTVNDLSKKHLYRPRIAELVVSPNLPEQFLICFGDTSEAACAALASAIYQRFPAPLLKVSLAGGAIESIKTARINQLSPAEWQLLERRLRQRRFDRVPPAAAMVAPTDDDYRIAMLVNRGEPLPPSDEIALQRFVAAGRQLGIQVDALSHRQMTRLLQYDGLFIRETTGVDHHTYYLARQAAEAGLVALDEPHSIVRCLNKIFLANLLQIHQIPAPRHVILSRHRRNQQQAAEALGFPLVIKVPDGAFSLGVHLAADEAQLREITARLFRRSALVLAQEYVYTDFDWRIGILNRQPIFACQYFMSPGHWQVIHHLSESYEAGHILARPLDDVPPEVMQVALDAANLIGTSLYGVDVKQVGERVLVIEVNDNPNIDHGVEDACEGDQLYLNLMSELLRRIKARRNGGQNSGRSRR